MAEYINKEYACSHPFANGRYDKVNANRDFIRGHESYKEWLEDIPAAEVMSVADVSKAVDEAIEWLDDCISHELITYAAYLVMHDLISGICPEWRENDG